MPRLDIDPSKVWWTSDTHFFHENIIKYCNRPFSDQHEMNDFMIERWNSRVNNGDVVIHVGDFLFGKKNDWNNILDRLNGDIVLVEGNHDRQNLKDASIRSRFKEIHNLWEVRIGDSNRIFSVCHYPMLTWRGRWYGDIHVHGHSHGGLEKQLVCPTDGTVVSEECRRIDVGVDCSHLFGAPSYSPISHAELLAYSENIAYKPPKSKKAKREM